MIERIKKIIEKEGNNPSTFADQIGISRSSMNHILNGRNNPSLDVLTKILTKYENINSEWLLFGRFPMYKGEKAYLQSSLFDEIPVKPKEIQPVAEYRRENELNHPEITPNISLTESFSHIQSGSKKINKIMVFYSDNTFDSFCPEKPIM